MKNERDELVNRDKNQDMERERKRVKDKKRKRGAIRKDKVTPD